MTLTDNTQQGWRDIATAPKDGSLVDLWCVNHLKWNKPGERLVSRKWGPCIDWMGIEREGWGLPDDYEPTHWMPLPPAPGEGE